MFEQLLSIVSEEEKSVVVSKLVVAASQCDPTLAKKHLDSMPALKDTGVDAEQLESIAFTMRSDLKRKMAGKEKKDVKLKDTENNAGQKTDKKKRKKRKVHYPQGFDPENPGPMPDAERWLPKWARKKGKKNRKKNDGRMTGAQGGNAEDSKVFEVKDAEFVEFDHRLAREQKAVKPGQSRRTKKNKKKK